MIPTIGRIVHYHSYGTPGGEYLPLPRAAIITAVRHDADTTEGIEGDVSLAVLNPSGMFFDPHVEYSETPRPGHWSWPPRV